MAMSVAAPQSVGVAESLPIPQHPERAHTLNHDLERALPRVPKDMEFGIRNRRHGTTNADDNAGTSPDSSATLTPSSSKDENTAEVSRLKFLVEETWHRLARFAQSPFFRPTADEADGSTPSDDGDGLKHERVDDFPKGYPQLAVCMNNNDTFLHFRRFGKLSTRILLHREIELTTLEQELDALDEEDKASPIMKYRLNGGEKYDGWDDKQSKLIDKAAVKYTEYADLLSNFAQLRLLNNSSERNHKQLLTWMNNNRPLAEGKDAFIFQADDFVSPARHFEKDRWFEDRIEIWLETNGKLKSLIKKFLQPDSEKRKTDDEYVDHYNSFRLNILGSALVVLLTVGGIAVPVLLLFLQSMNRATMATIAITFVFLFSVSVSVVTGARVQDLMFGTAAYSAIVIMFLGNLSQGSGGKCGC